MGKRLDDWADRQGERLADWVAKRLGVERANSDGLNHDSRSTDTETIGPEGAR